MTALQKFAVSFVALAIAAMMIDQSLAAHALGMVGIALLLVVIDRISSDKVI